MSDKQIRKPLAGQCATFESSHVLPGDSKSFEKLVSEFSLQIDTQARPPYETSSTNIQYSCLILAHM